MKRVSLICWVLVFVFALVFQVSLAGAADKKPFTAVGAMPLSGIAGALVDTGYGVIDAAEYINQTGGIEGRPYKVIMEDGRYDVPATLGIFNKYITTLPKDEFLYYCQYNTPGLKALHELVNKEAKIPVMAGSGSAIIFDEKVREHSPYYFATVAGYGEMWGAILKYIKEHHKKSTPPRCAFHYYDNSTGRDPFAALDKYSKKFGVDIVMREPFAATAQTFAPSFLKFRKEKIEYILFWSWSAKIGGRWFNEVRKYLPNVPHYGAHWTSALMYFDVAGEAYDGHNVVTPFPIETETDNEFVKIAMNMAKQQNRNVRLWQMYFQSWQMALIPAFAARQLIREGKPLTRDTLRDRIENIQDYDMLKMLGKGTLDYTNHKLSHLRMLRASWKKKTLVPQTDYFDVYKYLGEK